MKVVDRGTVTNLAMYVAEQEGFFEEEGVAMEPVNISGDGSTITAALVRSEVDILPQNPLTFANATGIDMAYFMGSSLDDVELVAAADDTELIEASEQGLDATLEALRGRTLGAAARSSFTFAHIEVLLRDAGLESGKDYKVKVSGIGAQSIAALKAGQVDAFVTDSYGSKVAQAEGVGQSVLSWADLEAEFPPEYRGLVQASLAARKSSLEENPEPYAKFGRALSKAMEFMQDPANTATVAKLVETQYNMPPQQAEELVTERAKVYSPKLTQDMFDRTMSFIKLSGAEYAELPTYEDSVVELDIPGAYE